MQRGSATARVTARARRNRSVPAASAIALRAVEKNHARAQTIPQFKQSTKRTQATAGGVIVRY